MNSNQDEIQIPIENDKPEDIKGSALKGIIYGAIIDIAGTLLLGILYGVVYALILARQNVPYDEIVARAEAMQHWSWSMLLLTAIGLLISFYAGYVCAKKSRVNLARNAAILSVISCGFSLLLGYDTYSVMENIFFMLLTSAAVFSGSFFWKNKNL